MITQISPEQLAKKLAEDSGKQLLILDVREPEEVAICKIANSLHIPMGEITQRYKELPDETDNIVVVCHHGMRSMQVAAFLEQQGLENIANLNGGIDAWAEVVEPSMQRY